MMINEQGDICVKQSDEGAFPKHTHIINTSSLSLSLSLSALYLQLYSVKPSFLTHLKLMKTLRD